MKTEHLKHLAMMESLHRFVEYNYPVNKEDVNSVAAAAQRHKNFHTSAAYFLLMKADHISKNTGIVNDGNYPHNHLPTMLEAVSSLEERTTDNEKLLTEKHKIELLAKGEITSAHQSLSLDNARQHMDRAAKLLDFAKEIV